MQDKVVIMGAGIFLDFLLVIPFCEQKLVFNVTGNADNLDFRFGVSLNSIFGW